MNNFTTELLNKHYEECKPYFIIKNSYGDRIGYQGIQKIDCKIFWNITIVICAIEPVDDYLNITKDNLKIPISYEDYNSLFSHSYRFIRYMGKSKQINSWNINEGENNFNN